MEAASLADRLVGSLVRVSLDERRRIGAQIARARQEQSWSQAELAERIGLSDARAVRYLESGQRNPYKHLTKIAEATGRPIDWFYGREPAGMERELGLLRQEVADLRAEIHRLRCGDEGEDGTDPLDGA